VQCQVTTPQFPPDQPLTDAVPYGGRYFDGNFNSQGTTQKLLGIPTLSSQDFYDIPARGDFLLRRQCVVEVINLTDGAIAVAEVDLPFDEWFKVNLTYYNLPISPYDYAQRSPLKTACW